jgi:hypothetical protein
MTDHSSFRPSASIPGGDEAGGEGQRLSALLERLRKTRVGFGTSIWVEGAPLNPDGPQAAEVIEGLVEALCEIADLAALTVVGGDDFDKGARAARLEAAEIANAALSRRTLAAMGRGDA